MHSTLRFYVVLKFSPIAANEFASHKDSFSQSSTSIYAF